MNSVVFNASTESYQLSQITYAGYVSAIAEEKRRNGSTHSFRFMTRMGMVHSYYKTVEEARNARTALGAMLATAKPNVFKHGNEMIDPSHVVSFSLVVALKKPQNECTHAVVVTRNTTRCGSGTSPKRTPRRGVALCGLPSMAAALKAPRRKIPPRLRKLRPLLPRPQPPQ